MAMKKKKGDEPPADNWIVTFADLMSIMLCFFVIMAAGSNPGLIDLDPRWTEIIAAIKQAFNYMPPPDSEDPVDLQILLNQLKHTRGRGGADKKGDAFDHSEGAVGNHNEVTTIRTGLQTTMGGQIRFAKLSAELSDEAVLRLRQIAARVKGHTNIFVVKGHTSRDEEEVLDASGRDLAYERACNAVAVLASLGLHGQSLRVQSCRDYEPLKEAAYRDADHAVNRRVEVVATESLMTEVRSLTGDVYPEKRDSDQTKMGKAVSVLPAEAVKPISALPPQAVAGH